MFRDITTLLKNPKHLHEAAGIFVNRFSSLAIDKVVGIESRGFILGAILAEKLGVGFIPVRKPGKLPSAVLREEYQLEYGNDAVEMHADALKPGERVLVHDDLLATGGTAAAACRLVERGGGIVVGCCFLIELIFLKGRERLKGRDVFSIVRYETE